MSPPWPAARPAEPPRVCGQCSRSLPKHPALPTRPVTEWHCPNPQCTWTVCAGCKGITDVAGLLPGRGDQQT